MSDALPHFYEFADFRIEAGKRLLFRSGNPVPISSRAFDALFLLVTRHGQVLKKEDLMAVIWPDTVVEENNLNQIISTLRRTLGESRGANLFIATVSGKGYRFTAQVHTGKVGAQEELTHIRIGVLPFENLGAGTERADIPLTAPLAGRRPPQPSRPSAPRSPPRSPTSQTSTPPVWPPAIPSRSPRG